MQRFAVLKGLCMDIPWFESNKAPDPGVVIRQQSALSGTCRALF
jgi:hypothetical protein